MREPRGDDAIRLRSRGERQAGAGGVNYWTLRVVYMRVLGLAWLIKGLYEGAMIIGLFGHSFRELDAAAQASTAFSAIGDCIAGVGLWLTVSWGGVIWIAASLVEIAFALNGAAPLVPSLAMLAPIVIYLALSILSARQVDRQI